MDRTETPTSLIKSSKASETSSASPFTGKAAATLTSLHACFPTADVSICLRVRGAGSAAINMCLVASGCVEAYYEIGIHVWDVAAASLIVSEAGGVLMDVEGKLTHQQHVSPLGCLQLTVSPCSGGDVDLMSRRILAANSKTITERLVKAIVPFCVPRDDATPPKKS